MNGILKALCFVPLCGALCVRVHLHAVREDAVHAVFHLGVLVLQVVEALVLPPALLLQRVHVLPVDPDGEGRGSVQDPVQLSIGDGGGIGLGSGFPATTTSNTGDSVLVVWF